METNFQLRCKKIKTRFKKSRTGTFDVRIKPKSHLQAALPAKQLSQSHNQFVQQAIDR
jgi:predicted HicB family RNase H-like nuclease